MTSTPDFLQRIATRTGLEPAAAGTLARLTVTALGKQLAHAAAVATADELPPTLAGWLLSAPSHSERGLAYLLAHIANAEHTSVAFAAEHVAVVCETLADMLRPAALRHLTESLPDDVGALLQHSDDAKPPAPVRIDPTKRTLAEADAVSEHPLFRAQPADSSAPAGRRRRR